MQFEDGYLVLKIYCHTAYKIGLCRIFLDEETVRECLYSVRGGVREDCGEGGDILKSPRIFESSVFIKRKYGF